MERNQRKDVDHDHWHSHWDICRKVDFRHLEIKKERR
nr:MAG TPA: hypothetical protein [Caudoviricetes sp.]